jgi:hypothetical protein
MAMKGSLKLSSHRAWMRAARKAKTSIQNLAFLVTEHGLSKLLQISVLRTKIIDSALRLLTFILHIRWYMPGAVNKCHPPFSFDWGVRVSACRSALGLLASNI